VNNALSLSTWLPVSVTRCTATGEVLAHLVRD
jgi:hypothetical protein